jgi:hypothetical protein
MNASEIDLQSLSISGVSVAELKGKGTYQNSDYLDFSTFLKQAGELPNA